MSLCTIHHRAFDHDLVGISAGYVVHVAERLLQDDDGPMLDLLKAFHRTPLRLPQRKVDRPDPERLDARFDRFLALS